MNASLFWNVIAEYNKHTLLIQFVLLSFIAISIIAAYLKHINFLPKIALGISCLFIGIVFFLYYGTQPIQFFFAAPLYIVSGILFIYEAKINKADAIKKPSIVTSILFILVLLYPAISYMLDHKYPFTVLLIMPCPLISLCILIYSCYSKRNRLLMLLLIIWGMTGIKSLIFNVPEDLILLICGFYGIYLMIAAKSSEKGLLTKQISKEP
ncbi:DUF6064 family protein [Clostridium oryzae]|uniref:Uncharacterized protein n=1 Tax=Clostridium oryzae TaxID=1450648 RepID=A0A1V4IZ20_9CLOT|nr:DUF6064 family protein [Clostridium oryzae]OPJ65143.1 hypothetical protein CLORY_01430 [Clostridium oryzae]